MRVAQKVGNGGPMSLDPTSSNDNQFNFYQQQQNLVAKSSKNAYGCPTINSAGHPNSSQNLSMMHFDEHSFIRNLLTNDRVLQNQNSIQSHDALPVPHTTSAGQHSQKSVTHAEHGKLINVHSNRILASGNFQTTSSQSHQGLAYNPLLVGVPNTSQNNMGSNQKMRISLYGGAGALNTSGHRITRSPQVNKKFRRDYQVVASQNTGGNVGSASA